MLTEIYNNGLIDLIEFDKRSVQIFILYINEQYIKSIYTIYQHYLHERTSTVVEYEKRTLSNKLFTDWHSTNVYCCSANLLPYYVLFI